MYMYIWKSQSPWTLKFFRPLGNFCLLKMNHCVWVGGAHIHEHIDLIHTQTHTHTHARERTHTDARARTRTHTHTRVSKRERQCDTFRNLLKQKYYKPTKSDKHNISQYLYQPFTRAWHAWKTTQHIIMFADAAEATSTEASTGQNEWPHSNSRNGCFWQHLSTGKPSPNWRKPSRWHVQVGDKRIISSVAISGRAIWFMCLLVGGFNCFNPSEKYELVSWDYYSQYMEKYKKCSKLPTSLAWRYEENARRPAVPRVRPFLSSEGRTVAAQPGQIPQRNSWPLEL